MGHRCAHCQRMFTDREALFQHSAAKHGRRQAQNLNPEKSRGQSGQSGPTNDDEFDTSGERHRPQINDAGERIY